MEFIWQDVCFRDEVKLLPAEALLHLHVVVAQAVLSCDLMTLGKVIDPLEFIEAFVKVALTGAC